MRTAEWDVVAWNRAARAVIGDYGALPEGRRNILHMFFSQPEARARIPHWESVARSIVATFRTETARNGASAHSKALVDELSLLYPEFKELWLNFEVSSFGEGVKSIQHPTVGAITFEYSTFAVDERPHLSMVVFNPATPEDKAGVRTLMGISDHNAAVRTRS